MFIVDFDDTLFDTQAFKQKRKQVLKDVGVTDIDYDTSYKKGYVSNDGVYKYSNKTHASALSDLGYNYDLVYNALKTTTTKKSLVSFLFDDTIFFINYLKSTNQKMILLSLGGASFQQLKSEGSGIIDFFDDVFFVNCKKHLIIKDILAKYKSNNAIWFINDKLQETKEIDDLYGDQLSTIIKSDTNNSTYKNIPVVNSLRKVVEFIRE